MRGLVAAVLAGLGWLALRVLPSRSRRPEPPQQHVEGASAAEHARKPAAVEQPSGIVTPNGLVRGDDSCDEEHKRQERTHWRIANFTGVITASAAVGAAVFAAGAYFTASEQAGIARDALVVSNRPWIKVDNIAVTQMGIESNVVVVLARVTVENLGHSPAENIFITPKLLILGVGETERDAAKQICDSAIKKPEARSVQVMFPGEVKQIGGEKMPQIFFRDMKEIIEEEAKAEDKALTSPHATSFALAGCITYTSGFRRLVYQTRFVTNIRERDPSLPLVDMPRDFNLAIRGLVPVDGIVLSEIVSGTFVR